ncbi:RtcB family protein [Tissierella carlieri]|jgi:tRNA-splicing ligase RtcB|uniref:RtcB family protein n=1 Tax=Tissierella carlieri TaxID=689904 RepID=UPI001C123063|nr:RtcB family protein [Tissierella carlieri]MBU5310659.1 RtcB family protein [Tissierella carlieri]MDU5080953.1 RtcB family protein [Bacillota bacterium]
MELQGRYNIAKIFTDNLEDGAKEQILDLLNQDFIQDSKVRIMPDVHQGMGCVIGFTADMGDKVIPNIVGVDIGCGMLTVELRDIDIDLPRLDDIINKKIPSGKSTHNERKFKFDKLKDLYCLRDLKDTKRIERSIGTLGGGNHFIEIGVDSNNNKYLVIHSGSRNLGKQVAEIYQRLAIDLCSGKGDYFIKREEIIARYKAEGRRKEIKKVLEELEKDYAELQPKYPKALCYLTGEHREKYLNDMRICQEYASLNREVMSDIILKNLLGKELSEFNYFETIHNYINFKDNIIRKGAIAAYKGEKVLIPINMRDGSIIAIGKGNPEWNYSAPHGAGRLMSRNVAKEAVTLDEFKKSMEGIYSTSISEHTLDESPFAYKAIEEILNNITETAEVIDIIKPIYNFKA